MSLINFGMLAGLLAVAAPLIIHLLRSRRFERADLGSLRFLREAMRETARWNRLREIALLLARLAIIVLLVLLFCRPFLPKPVDSSEASMEAVVLLDCSESTAGKRLGSRVAAQLREQAEQAVENLPAATRLTLAEFADVPREVRGFGDAGVAGVGDYSVALRWAADRLRLSTAPQREILLVSDLQDSALPDLPLEDWPANVPVRILTVPPPGKYNLAISSVKCTTPYARDVALVAVELMCSGEVPPGEVTVSLAFEKGETLRRTVALTSAKIIFEVPLLPGLHQGTARVEGTDAWPEDDSRPFAFHIKRPRKIVLVDGEPGETRFAGETYFLEMALSVGADGLGHSPFEVEVRQTLGPLAETAAVAFCNVRSLSGDEQTRLAEFLKKGGGVAWFPGDRSERWHYDRLRDAGLFPAKLHTRSLAVPRLLSDWDDQKEPLTAFSSTEKGDLGRIVFRDYFDLRPEPGMEPVALLGNGSVAMLAAEVKGGRMIIVPQPVDREWTDWPTERIFLPLMHEIFTWLSEHGDDQKIKRVERGMEERRKPGVYVAESTVLVTLPREECRAEFLAEENFRKRMGIGEAPERQFDMEDDLPEHRERRGEFWRWLALALLLFLTVENLLADRPFRKR